MDDGLRLTDLRILRGAAPMLELDLHVPPAAIVSLMGPSGVGKSTLLAAITGQLSADFTLSGDIQLNGRHLRPLPAQLRRVGILYQDHLLFPHLSVGGNLAFGLSPDVPRKLRRDRVEAALHDIGLDGYHDRDPETLSGGQKARVAMMRTLLSNPDLLLLDEPFSRLDKTLRDQMRQLVFAVARDRDLPVLLVTHDAEDAQAAGGPVIQLTQINR
ncbi:ATP-binding cassette domain-containing protein [Tritonibacter scottomollicae]|uniref:Putative thiamine transport system ATP-binding protein n=1 Tax=Tritonibacter scottomollicae TaxID=483013 RepID=A0A2T1AP95_TRISK|nr:ATP-binding cassette domain-containing protein [Tritonibacter scottomollicae]PRZ50393.1 putative thiamine transport system ATP-binding protein [Tritonibacter scottomollicae]